MADQVTVYPDMVEWGGRRVTRESSSVLAQGTQADWEGFASLGGVRSFS